MYLRFVLVLLLSGLGMAQPRPQPASFNPSNQGSAASSQNSSQPASEQTQHQGEEKPRAEGNGAGRPSAATPSKVSLDTPVVTIDGFCDPTALATVVKGPSAGCKSVVTRRQFERLVDALDPNMKPPLRRDLANAIGRISLFSRKAHQMGLDKDPRYADMLQWGSLQALANALNVHIQKKAGEISDADIEKYYKENSADFQQCELQRIFIPKNKQESSDSPANANSEKNGADEAAMRAEAEKIQAKAAAGGDFVALQKEALDETGVKLSPNVNLGKRLPTTLPASHRRIFDLQPGQVSELISDPTGFFVYKVLSKQTVPLSEARKQIHSTLQSEGEQASEDSLFSSIKKKLNNSYFTPSTSAASEDAVLKPESSTQTAPGQAGTASSDSEWADSTVRSYLLEKTSGWVPPPENVVPQNAPVIVIDGLCEHKPPSAADCHTIVTRAKFEAMMNTIDPNAAADVRARVAERYADLLVRGQKSRQLGLENTDQYKLAMAFTRMDTGFKMLSNFILERSRQLTKADLAEFYRENPRLFEEIKTVRIVIPQYKAFPPEKGKPTPEQIAAGHAEMKKEAESVAARAALPGANFQALENEGWKFSDYVEQPPDVAQNPLLRWEIWPRTRIFIFDLKVGQVSGLIDEPRNGFYVYKIIAKREVPLEEAQAYIRKRYTGVRYEDAAGKLLAKVKSSLNDEYFGKEVQPPAPGSPGEVPGIDTKIPSLDIKIPKKVIL